MDYVLQTYQDGKQLLGSDFSRIVRNATPRKIDRETQSLTAYLYALASLKCYLKEGFVIKAVPKH